MNIAIGSRIREVRYSKGMTMHELAAKTEIPRSSISRYESGYREPTIERLRNIAQALNISVGYLLDDSNIPFLGRRDFKRHTPVKRKTWNINPNILFSVFKILFDVSKMIWEKFHH